MDVAPEHPLGLADITNMDHPPNLGTCCRPNCTSLPSTGDHISQLAKVSGCLVYTSSPAAEEEGVGGARGSELSHEGGA